MIRKSLDLVNQRGGAAQDDVLEVIHDLMHLYRSQQHRMLRDAGQEVTHLETRVLGFFARHPGATLSALVAHAGRDKGQLARLVGGLRERGLLVARVDEADRRNQHLHLTDAGAEVQQGLRRHARKLSAAAVRGLGEEDKRELLALLARVRSNLEGAGVD